MTIVYFRQKKWSPGDFQRVQKPNFWHFCISSHRGRMVARWLHMQEVPGSNPGPGKCLFGERSIFKFVMISRWPQILSNHATFHLTYLEVTLESLHFCEIILAIFFYFYEPSRSNLCALNPKKQREFVS